MTRTFADLQHEPGLHKFLVTAEGTLYAVPGASGWPERMIRHFDRELPPELVGAYAEITAAADQWLAGRRELGELAEIEQPEEVGEDFVARKYHVYQTTTRSYAEGIEPPQELELLRDRLREAFKAPVDGERERIVRDVLARTFLEPSERVYFNEMLGQFVNVEPKIAREDAQRWSAADGS